MTHPALVDRPVVVDTDAWSILFARRPTPLAETLRRALSGRAVMVATQTRAEVLAGLAMARLGNQRESAIMRQLDRTTTLPVGPGVVQAYASLAGRAREVGHPLWQPRHTADRWIAATAIGYEMPLLAVDAIYRDVPGLLRLPYEEGQP